MLRASIRPLAFAAINDAGAAAFGAWPHVKSVSDVAATAIVTDHAWPQDLDSVDACEAITLESSSPQRTLRSAPPENRRGASDGTVTTLRPAYDPKRTSAVYFCANRSPNPIPPAAIPCCNPTLKIGVVS